jgi:FSR family fosmidomycin resistance protein-like MFS transporter
MAGGYIADKFGWSKVALISLITSAVLITFCRNLPVLAITGMFFFQFPMAITLAAMAKIFKGRPAFAFGLTCLALVVGAYPSLVSKNLSFPALNFIIVVVTGLFLWIGMNILDKMYLKEKIKIS